MFSHYVNGKSPNKEADVSAFLLRNPVVSQFHPEIHGVQNSESFFFEQLWFCYTSQIFVKEFAVILRGLDS